MSRGSCRRRRAEAGRGRGPLAASLAALAAAATIAAAAVAGCGPEVGAPLHIAWHLADGRTCAEAGVETVAVALEGPDLFVGEYRCVEGEGEAIEIGPLAAGRYRVRLEGRSAYGAALYAFSGELALEATDGIEATVLVAHLGYVGGG